MRLSDFSSRFARSKTPSAAETTLTTGTRASHTIDRQVSASTVSRDDSEKILSFIEPWPTSRHTPETSPPETPAARQTDRDPSITVNAGCFKLVGQDCSTCGGPCERMVTRSSNRNGNAGRPYFKCVPCNKFIRFDDARGLDQGDQGNPLCDCGQSSRRQITSREKGRRIFYVCTIGACQFFEWHRNEDGSRWSISEDVVAALQRLRVV